MEGARYNLMDIKAYAAKHNDVQIRLESRSGGVFTALSDRILELGGSIYGCKLDKNFRAVHVKAVNVEERNDLRGSKYVQSDMINCFSNIKSDLQNNQWVLFSGTSCQVSGLLSFLGQTNTEKLICVDIVCHGVPSPLLWNKFLKFIEEHHNGKIEHVEFRDKRKFGWASNVQTFIINGKVYSSEDYAALYYSHHALRMACYKCPYKSVPHPSDITIADFWGYEKVVPDFNDNCGISLVLVNTKKGADLFKIVSGDLTVIECNIKDCMQPALIKSCAIPKGRSLFWKRMRTLPMDKIVRYYGTNGMKVRLKKFLSGIIPKKQLSFLRDIVRKIN